MVAREAGRQRMHLGDLFRIDDVANVGRRQILGARSAAPPSAHRDRASPSVPARRST